MMERTEAATIGIGVIGAGILGSRHARVFAELPGSRLIGVADLDRLRAEEVTAKHGGAAYADYNDLLSDPSVDAVAISTPDHLHAAPTIAALEAGKHVLVEKPLATNLADARRMIAAAETAQRVLQVNYSQRFVPEFAFAKAQIEGGTIGTPLIARSIKNDTVFVPTEMIAWASRTSPIFFMTSHDLDLVCWYFASAVEEVFAYDVSHVLAKRGIATPDAVEAMVRFTSGALASFHSAWIHPNTYPTVADAYLEIIGSDGVLSLGRSWENLLYTGGAGTQVKLGTAYEANGHLHGAFRHSLELFLQSITAGTEPMTAARKTLDVTVAQCAILESLARRRPVRPHEIEG